MIHKLTGHPTVDAIGQLNFEGNITPHTWYSHIRYVNKRGTYTDHLAIAILAEIVYWYRPTAIYDETTGRQIGWRKKFKSDKLKKSYAALSEKLGATDKQIRESMRLLVELDLIDLEFRVDIEKDIKIGNVMYIGLNPERLKEITFTVLSLDNFTPIPEIGNSPPLYPKWGTPYARNGEHPMPEMGKSTIYTKTTPENTNKEESPLTPKGDDGLIPELKTLEAGKENANTLTLSPNKIEAIPSTQIIVLGVNVPPSAKKPKQDADFFEPLRSVYNQAKPATWAECKNLNDKRFRALKRLYQELGDRTAQTMQEALCFVNHDRWWRETYSSRCIDGLLVSGRVQQLSDSYKAINPNGNYDTNTGLIGVIDPDTGDRITDPNHIAILKGLGRI